jgi:hypothetical protein
MVFKNFALFWGNGLVDGFGRNHFWVGNAYWAHWWQELSGKNLRKSH